MGDRLRVQSANLLTGLRVALTPAFVVAVWCAPQNPALGLAAAGLFVLIAASDVWDGRLARHYRNESNAGRMFDHLADIGFILSALGTYVLESLVPWWVPATIGASFAFYVLDSWAHRGVGVPQLIRSRVGHVAGICNYSLIGILVFNHTAAIHLLPAETLRWLFWLVPVYSAAAVISRAMVCAPWHQSASELSIARR